MSYKSSRSKVTRAVERQVMRGLAVAGRNTAAAIRQDLSIPGPEPSPPGVPPHRQTGALMGGVDTTRPRREGEGYEVLAGVLDKSQWPKAVRLARGFVGADRLGRVYNQAPRPYLGSVERRRAKILQEIANG